MPTYKVIQFYSENRRTIDHYTPLYIVRSKRGEYRSTLLALAESYARQLTFADGPVSTTIRYVGANKVTR